MSKRKKDEYKIYWWIQIYPFGYERDSELRCLELNWTIKAKSYEKAIRKVTENYDIIGDDFIGYPDPDFVDSHPDIEIVWTEDIHAHKVLDLTEDEHPKPCANCGMDEMDTFADFNAKDVCVECAEKMMKE